MGAGTDWIDATRNMEADTDDATTLNGIVGALVESQKQSQASYSLRAAAEKCSHHANAAEN